jgi:predicted DCC family thiol-disulfide oxidoreductase YuxK
MIPQLAGCDGSALKSVVYLRPGQEPLLRSDALLAICRDLGGWWALLAWLRFIPEIFRQPFYSLVAENRYRWFGRLEQCRLPAPGEAARFLD